MLSQIKEDIEEFYERLNSLTKLSRCLNIEIKNLEEINIKTSQLLDSIYRFTAYDKSKVKISILNFTKNLKEIYNLIRMSKSYNNLINLEIEDLKYQIIFIKNNFNQYDLHSFYKYSLQKSKSKKRLNQYLK